MPFYSYGRCMFYPGGRMETRCHEIRAEPEGWKGWEALLYMRETSTIEYPKP
jgi:hypothetical protein